MKIKRWKEMLTGIALVGAITPTISISVNKNNKSQVTNNLSILNNTSSKTIVDYSMVEKMMSEISLKSLNNQNYVELTPEQEQKVQELQQHYLNLFKSNNYSWEEIQSYMCENFPQYKEECEKMIQTTYHNVNINFINISWLTDQEKLQKIKEQINQLEIQRGILIGACATFSALAAGFYAAAFWTFGATTPWAIACTNASIQTGVMQDQTLKVINSLFNIVNKPYLSSCVSFQKEWTPWEIAKITILAAIEVISTVSLVLDIINCIVPGGKPASVPATIAIKIISQVLSFTLLLIEAFK